jgi:hypothetical protein
MQILYEAPFIAVALLAFFICVLFPKGRKYAFPTSGATFAFYLGALVGFLLMIFIALHVKHPATFWFAISSITGGLTSSVIAVIAMRLIFCRLTKDALRWVVAFGCLVHLLGLTVITLSAFLYPIYRSLSNLSLALLFVTLPLSVSIYATVLLTRRSEQFRPSRGNCNDVSE